MLCLDHVNCSVVSEQFINVLFWLKSTLYKHFIPCQSQYFCRSTMCCLILLCLFFNMQRSFRVCVHARVAMHAYELGRKCIHVRNKIFFEGMLVENEPPCGESCCFLFFSRVTSDTTQMSRALFSSHARVSSSRSIKPLISSGGK